MPYRDYKAKLNEWQLQQLTNTDAALRQMNHGAELELLRIADGRASRNEYRRAGEAFAVLAIEINSTVNFRNEALSPDPVMAPGVAIIVHRPGCPKRKEFTDADEQQLDPGHSVEVVDPEHHEEVDALLELVQRVSELVFDRYKVRKVCSTIFFIKLSRLQRAMQRQRRQLRELYSGPAAKTQFLTCDCSSCARPLEEILRDYPIPQPDLPKGIDRR
jgi:hypothetical protein